MQFEKEIKDLKSGFQFAISQTLQDLAEGDLPSLERYMEPTLYSEISEGMGTLKRRGHTLSIVNPEADSFVYLYNEKIYSGLNIERESNRGPFYSFPKVKKLRTSRQKMAFENINIYAGGDLRTGNIVLKLDVVYLSLIHI